MVAEILTIGDELNRGEIVDTNAAWLGEELTRLGLHVRYRSGVNDHAPDMTAAMKAAAGRAQVVVASGGLGPTSDDLTVEVAAALIGAEVVQEPAHQERLVARFAERGLALTPNNLRQVRVPKGAVVLPNWHGLAPGFSIRYPIGNQGRDPGAEGAIFFFMPGVPKEMKPMFSQEVAPRLSQHLTGQPATARRTYRVIGLGESHVDHRLRGLIGQTPGATIHYRLAFPEVLVTLVTRGASAAVAQGALDGLEPELRRRLGGALYSEGGDDLPIVVGRKLKERGQTLATAESCTGGLIGQLLTAVPGSSAYFLGGIISYANEVKTGVLGVSPATLTEHGAVSAQCVVEMAQGARRLTGATYALAVSGVAGPDGGSPDKPVGTVHLAVAGPDRAETRKLYWPGDREQVRRIAAFAALNILDKILTPARALDRGDPADPIRDRLDP